MPDKDKPEIPLDMSAAKEIDPNGLHGTSLEGKEPLTDEFNRSAAEDIAQKMLDEQNESEQGGSEQQQQNLDPPAHEI